MAQEEQTKRTRLLQDRCSKTIATNEPKVVNMHL